MPIIDSISVFNSIVKSATKIQSTDDYVDLISIPHKYYHLLMAEPKFQWFWDHSRDLSPSTRFLDCPIIPTRDEFALKARFSRLPLPITAKDLVNERFGRLTILVKSRAEPVSANSDEQTALDCLREMISEAEFRRYLKHGFILVKGRSGDIYQIFRVRRHTKVWRDGRVVQEVCVRIKDRAIPLTDNVIAFKTIIEADEEEYKKLGNVFDLKAA